jgi:hypothetical protein
VGEYNNSFLGRQRIALFFGELHVVYMDWRHVYHCVGNVMWPDLDSLAFILHFLNPFWIAALILMKNYTDNKTNLYDRFEINYRMLRFIVYQITCF